MGWGWGESEGAQGDGARRIRAPLCHMLPCPAPQRPHARTDAARGGEDVVHGLAGLRPAAVPHEPALLVVTQEVAHHGVTDARLVPRPRPAARHQQARLRGHRRAGAVVAAAAGRLLDNAGRQGRREASKRAPASRARPTARVRTLQVTRWCLYGISSAMRCAGRRVGLQAGRAALEEVEQAGAWQSVGAPIVKADIGRVIGIRVEGDGAHPILDGTLRWRRQRPAQGLQAEPDPAAARVSSRGNMRCTRLCIYTTSTSRPTDAGYGCARCPAAVATRSLACLVAPAAPGPRARHPVPPHHSIGADHASAAASVPCAVGGVE